MHDMGVTNSGGYHGNASNAPPAVGIEHPSFATLTLFLIRTSPLGGLSHRVPVRLACNLGFCHLLVPTPVVNPAK